MDYSTQKRQKLLRRMQAYHFDWYDLVIISLAGVAVGFTVGAVLLG